ncbi:unnamed protein product [Ectocarpus sp. 13 AM-2016]
MGRDSGGVKEDYVVSRTRPAVQGRKASVPRVEDGLKPLHQLHVNLPETFFVKGTMPDVALPRPQLLQAGFTMDQINNALHGWQLLSNAMVREIDQPLIGRWKSPREAMETLDAVYKPETQGEAQQLFHRFERYQVDVKVDPNVALRELDNIRDMIQECGGAALDDRFVFTRFVNALPQEYEVAKENLSYAAKLARGDLMRVTGTRYNTLCSQREAEKSHMRAAGQAFIAADGAGKGEGRNRSAARETATAKATATRAVGAGRRNGHASGASDAERWGIGLRNAQQRKATLSGARFARDSAT